MPLKKHIPNAITSFNLMSGCVGILLAFRGSIEIAALMILLASVFDFLDGMAARLLHVRSEIGKELDSLADLVSFGVLPGALVYVLLESTTAPAWVPAVALLIPVFSALRLAKFNLDPRQTDSFLGLPVPAHAIFWVGVALLSASEPANPVNQLLKSTFNQPIVIILLTAALSLLLVSELPLFSLKFKNLKWAHNQTRFLFLGLALLLLILLRAGSLPMIIALYVILSLFENLLGSNRSIDAQLKR